MPLPSLRAYKATKAADDRYNKKSLDEIQAESKDEARHSNPPTILREIHIKHKYAGQIACNLEIGNGGGV